MGVTLGTPVQFTPASSSNPRTATVAVPNGTGRVVVVCDAKETVRTYSSVTFNGQAMTLSVSHEHSTQAGLSVAQWRYNVPDELPAGDYTASIQMSSSSIESQAFAHVLIGVDHNATPVTDSDESNGTNPIASSLSVQADGAVVSIVVNAGGTVTFTWSGGVTEDFDPDLVNFAASMASGVYGTAGTKAPSASGSTARQVLASVAFAPLVGPAITTQPTAQTAIISNGGQATFSFACSAAITSVLWEIETAVGSGVYTTITNGVGGWSISTNLGAGSGSATITATGTGDSGKRIRVTPTDANGSTVSNAVVLTIKNGPVLAASSGTLNGSGQLATTATCDVVCGTGQFVRLRGTYKGVTIYGSAVTT